MEYAKKEFEAKRGCFNLDMKLKIAQFDTGYTNHPEIKNVIKKDGRNYVAGWYQRLFNSNWRNDARDRLRNLRPILWAAYGT